MTRGHMTCGQTIFPFSCVGIVCHQAMPTIDLRDEQRNVNLFFIKAIFDQIKNDLAVVMTFEDLCK